MQMTGRRRWWVTGLVALWALALVAAAVWSAHADQPTVREQSELRVGRETLDRAVGAVSRAAGPTAVVEVAPYELTPGCRLTMARDGAELDRTVSLRVTPGTEEELFDRLVAGLPAEWGARYNPNRNRFFADAGDYVAVRGEMTSPGLVELTVGTGCRPGDDPELEELIGTPGTEGR